MGHSYTAPNESLTFEGDAKTLSRSVLSEREALVRLPCRDHANDGPLLFALRERLDRSDLRGCAGTRRSVPGGFAQ